jgi:ureidoglycolate amidohydrolase
LEPEAEALSVDVERLAGELRELAAISDGAESEEQATQRIERQGRDGSAKDAEEGIAVTRVVFAGGDLRARGYVEGLARELGLRVRRDAVGNTFFRWESSEPELEPVATGSHIDAIPNAGMYDGTVGVLGGLAAVRVLKDAGFLPRRSIEVILFTSEEPTRFGIGCLGSRMMAGVLSSWDAVKLRDKDGRSLEELRSAAGFTGELGEVQIKPGSYAGFVELHIEQGPELEREGLQIGVVTAIAAPASLRITVEGEGGHAGAMLMPVRRDALVAAAEIVVAVEKAALSTGAADTVATVGMCEVFPGAVNSVPSRVKLSLDVRDIDLRRRDGVLAAIDSACHEIAARRGVKVTREMVNADAPASCDEGVVSLIGEACALAGASSVRMVSRAYHDSLFMARICPVGMVFIPCRGGVSHRPDEFAKAEDIGVGVGVLAMVLRELSTRV